MLSTAGKCAVLLSVLQVLLRIGWIVAESDITIMPDDLIGGKSLFINTSEEPIHKNVGVKHSKNMSGYGGITNILLKKIFWNYNKEALPPSRPVEVHMDVLLIKVKSTVEKEGIFECVIALFIEWNDHRMSWNPEDYDNLTILAFDPDKVWTPDVAMTNSADHLYSISRDNRFIVRVTHTGAFKFVPTGTARTWCDLKLLTFPFDYQTCSLEFESWSLDSTSMTFDNRSNLLVDDSFASNQFWLCEKNVSRYYHTYEFTGETFTRLRFDFQVRRKSTFYIINLIFPCTTLSAIQLLVFLISSTDTTADRIGFGTTNLLTLVVFQTIVTEEMPKTSDAVTALSKYVIALILVSAVGIFESVCVERMLCETAEEPPPRTMRYFLNFIPNIMGRGKNHLYASHRHKTNNNRRFQTMRNKSHQTFSAKTRLGVSSSPTTMPTSPSDYEMGDPRSQLTRRNSYHSAVTTGMLSFDSIAYSNGKTNDLGVITINLNLTVKQPMSDYEQSSQTPVDETFDLFNEMGKDQKQSIDNATLWAVMAHKIDCLCFILCLMVAVIVPSVLFFPLLDFKQECSDDAGILAGATGPDHY